MAQLEPNTLLQNRYLVREVIGKGGMGEVYSAVDQRMGSPVVIKRTYFAGDDVLGGGFENEARALGRLRHTSLPKVHDHFVEGGEQYMVMDFIPGDDLAARLAASNKPFPVAWVMFWADQLLDALIYLHSNEPPIVHRDIKPQNLKLTDNNNVMLLDFGLSRKGYEKLEATGAAPSGFLKPYAPLEQIRGNDTYPRSDVYSLAATLYFLLTNVVPPDATQRADAVLSGMPDPLRAPSGINPEVTPSISDAIMKGLAVSHDQRHADARTMQKALREAYSRMEEEASAKTVIMESPASSPSADFGGATIPYDMLSTEAKPSAPTVPQEAAPDFDATVKYDGPIILDETAPVTNQANIKTEVFFAPEPSSPEAPVATAETAVPDATMPVVVIDETPSPAPDATMPIINVEEPPAPMPNATMPIVNFADSTSIPASGSTGTFENFSDSTDFSSPATPFSDSGFGATVPPSEVSSTQPVGASPENAEPAVAVTPAVAPKKRSKGMLIGVLVGLFLLATLAIVGGGVGWYMYSGGNLPFLSTPTPTPTVLPTETPTPTPSPTATPESNQNVNTATPSPTPSATPEETPDVSTPERPQNTPNPRVTTVPTPRQTPVASTPRPTMKPTVKPTPKPTLRGREIPQ